MFREFFTFDLRYQLRSPLLWIVAFALALLAFWASVSDTIQIGGSIGNVHRNAPVVIANWLALFGLFGLFVVTAFVAQPLLRDTEMRTDELFFATPMRKLSYVWGRWSAGVTVTVIVYLFVALAMMIAALGPWIDPERLGPFSLRPYFWALAVLVVPNMMFMGALFAVLAVTTRKLLGVYLGVIAFFILWLLAQRFTSDVEYRTLASLIDPFGIQAFQQVTRYWSANERNTQLPEFAGMLLSNRLIWLSVSAVLLFITHALFRPMREGVRSKLFKRNRRAQQESPQPIAVSPPVVKSATQVSVSRQFLHQVWFDTRGVLRSVPFLIIVAFAIFNLGGSLPVLDQLYGTSVHPVTSLMLDLIRGSFAFLLALIVAYYGGELVWRERDAKLSELTDALPIPNWVPLTAKVVALIAVIVVFMCVGGATTIVFQLIKGHTDLELPLYLEGLSMMALPFILSAIAGVFLQVVSNNKFVGYLLFVLLMIATLTLPGMNFQHNLYLYASTPGAPYSDMNGFGHFLPGWGWFNAYWTALAVALLILASAFWPRGLSEGWRTRFREARLQLRGGRRLALFGSLAAFVALGIWIFYNTNVLNEYVPSDEAQDRLAHYEREFRQFKDLPQPAITVVRANVDIYPAERRAVVSGHYTLVNKYDTPIEDVHINIDRRAKAVDLKFAAADLKRDDELAGYKIYKLKQPLVPGATMDFEFKLDFASAGFENNDVPFLVLNNGTFFNNAEMMPQFGYQEGAQIIDRAERRKRKLGEVPRVPKLEDEAARRYNFIGRDDWIDFEATVSTSPDQIALAPGYLQKEWTQDGRRYFHYKMDIPIIPYFCFLSADWQVERDSWHGIPIEVYYDKAHPYNVKRMIAATQKSLDYYSREFGPYPQKQVRILEFPRYRQFAQSFANTIPFSEGIGFIANLEDPEDIDYVFYVTAHEMAHQWWGDEVMPANVQGSAMLSESTSQYSALMVMEKEYGRDKMRRFMKYELDRYLRGRGSELVEELPLMRVENQAYVHYAKGSLIFYRLRDEIGEETLNKILARYIKDKGFQPPPYTTTAEFLTYLKEGTPPEKHALIDELFSKIVFYDNRVTEAKSVKRTDGKYDVTITYSAAKMQSDGKGVESPMTLDDEIEIGVFERKPGAKESEEKVLYFAKQRLSQAAGSITVQVDREPFEVGLDPYNKMIDRDPDDNRKQVTN